MPRDGPADGTLGNLFGGKVVVKGDSPHQHRIDLCADVFGQAAKGTLAVVVYGYSQLGTDTRRPISSDIASHFSD